MQKTPAYILWVARGILAVAILSLILGFTKPGYEILGIIALAITYVVMNNMYKRYEAPYELQNKESALKGRNE